jgi:hypothetical protein
MQYRDYSNEISLDNGMTKNLQGVDTVLIKNGDTVSQGIAIIRIVYTSANLCTDLVLSTLHMSAYQVYGRRVEALLPRYRTIYGMTIAGFKVISFR